MLDVAFLIQTYILFQDPREEVMTLERVLLQTIKFDLQVELYETFWRFSLIKQTRDLLQVNIFSGYPFWPLIVLTDPLRVEGEYVLKYYR